MKVLVTGGGGFIGSNLVEALLRRGDDVVVLDNFLTGRRENLDHVEDWKRAGGGSFELIEGDICCLDTARKAVAGCHAVLHQAALPSVPRSVSDPITSHQINVDGTLNMLVASRDEGVDRFVAASSSSVYGDSPTLPKVETMTANPISPYGLDKYSAETYLRLFKQLYGLNTVALRYFNVFGPRQDPGSDYAAVIPKFVTLIASGKAPTIHGDGQQTRDFSFIENVVQANLKAAEADEKACGEQYNIACGDRISLLQLVDRINETLGTDIKAEHGPARAGDIAHSLADIDKAKALLGYEPTVDLNEGLRRTTEWFVGQKTA